MYAYLKCLLIIFVFSLKSFSLEQLISDSMSTSRIEMTDAEDPDTCDTIVFIENGKLKKLSKCDGTFPPQFHYHTVGTIVGLEDSLAGKAMLEWDENYRLFGTDDNATMVQTEIEHNIYTGTTTLPGMLLHDTSISFVIGINTAVGQDDKTLFFRSSGGDSTRGATFALNGIDATESGEAVLRLDPLSWFRIYGGSIKSYGSDVVHELGGGTGHGISFAAGASNVNNIAAYNTSAAELHLYGGLGDGIALLPNRITLGDSVFITADVRENSSPESLLVVKGNGEIGWTSGVGLPTHSITDSTYGISDGAGGWHDGQLSESGGYVVFGIPSQTLIAGADPTHSFILSGAASYTMGIDDSNNDYFCIRPGTSVGDAGLLMNADGDVGVGKYTPISPGAFSVYKSTTNVQNYGLYGLPISNSSANGNHSVVGFYGYARARPDAGVTNSGVCQGINGAALLDDLGTVSEGAAAVSYIGDLNKAGTWSEAVGLKVIHYRQAATEDWYADIKIEDICTGGSVTEDWCIYSEHDAPSRLINDLQLDADDVYLQLGAAQDFEVSYDGTDGILNPRAIGSGNLKINGNVYPNTDDTYYVGKNDDDSPFAYKGIILKDQTDGKYYRIELNNGSVDVVDLTD